MPHIFKTSPLFYKGGRKMNTLEKALKKIGIETKKEDKNYINQDFLLPFIPETNDAEEDNQQINHMKWIRQNWFCILEDELNGYECKQGDNIKKLLLRNLDKIRVVEKNVDDNILSSLYFFFEYQPLSKRFLVKGNVFGFENICEKNNIEFRDFSDLNEDKKREAIAFYLTKRQKEVVLYINKASSIMAFLDIPYSFEEIQKDEYAMYCLQSYLKNSKYPPNPKTKYYIVRDYDYIFDKNYYFLKRAIY